MSDFILGHNDVGYLGTFTGGTYISGLGLEMFSRQLLTAIANTTTDTPYSLDITLDGGNPGIEVVGLINHNLTSSGTYQWRAYGESGRTTLLYDSGAISSGTFFTGMEYKTSIVATTSGLTTPYWRLTLSDSGNPDGGYRIGRVFLGERFYPDKNMNYGLQFGVKESSSDLITSQYGIETFIDAPNKRNVKFNFKLINNSKGNDFLRFSMNNGIIGTCVFEFDPSDKQEGLRTFACRQDVLTPLDFAQYNVNNFAISLTEII